MINLILNLIIEPHNSNASPHVWAQNSLGRVEEALIELRTSYFDTMLNYLFSQKLKLLEHGKLNHLTT